MVVYYHCLFHNSTTIEEGNDIVAVTLFITKPLKKAITIVVTFFCNKAIKEGDGNCNLLFILKHRKESDNIKLLSPLSLQHHHRRRQHHIVIVLFFSVTPPHKKMMVMHCRLFLFKHKEEADDNNLLPLPSSLQHHQRRR